LTKSQPAYRQPEQKIFLRADSNVFSELLPLAPDRVKDLRTTALFYASNRIDYREISKNAVLIGRKESDMAPVSLDPGKTVQTGLRQGPDGQMSAVSGADPLASLSMNNGLVALFESEQPPKLNKQEFDAKNHLGELGIIGYTTIIFKLGA
jgi:hypothetical protein